MAAPEQPAGACRPASAIEPPAVSVLESGDETAWDEFVLAHPEGSFFHRAGWRQAIRSAFAHDCPYLLVHRGERITGILPLVEVRSRLFGRALISTAFCVGGGVLAADRESEAALLTAAEALARERRADRIELRSAPPDRPGWTAAGGLYFGFRKALDPDPERNLGALRRKQRAMIRKGRELGLTAELDGGIDRFHHVYAASVHRLGTPVPPRRYFAALKRAFGQDCEILTLVHQGRPVAAVMSFHFKDAVLPYYGGSVPEARALAASDVLYHEVMTRAVLVRGARVFDFGRSKAGTGAFDFKRHWGFEPSPITYGFWLSHGGRPPEINPLNPKYRLFIELWRHQPLWLSKLVGPLIARELG